MIYCEYIARDRAIPLEIFRHHGRQDWAGDGDRMVANLARTMKMAAEPHYMCWWKIPSIARMDGWEAHFRTPEGRDYAAHSPVARAMTFDRAGLYDEVWEGEVAPGLLHYVEFYRCNGTPLAAQRDLFRRRAGDGMTLAYVIDRVGLLAPDPGGIAVWSGVDYRAAESFVRKAPDVGAMTVERAGFYRNFGEDIP